MASQVITFYDISPNPGLEKARSFNTARVRFALNYKGLAFKTVWARYGDVERVCKSIGASPTGTKPNGDPLYTFPVIHDPSTDKLIADGPVIVKYLDDQYPDTPKVIPPGTDALIAAFINAHLISIAPIHAFTVPIFSATFNGEEAVKFRRAREEDFGKKVEDLVPSDPVGRAAEWAKVKAGYDTMDKWLQKSEGPFIMGDTISFADGNIAAFLRTFKNIFGEDSQEWKDMRTWNEGRWENRLHALEKYLVDDWNGSA
ncbi:hypothetical protein HGRIS_006243 [Hohenbuehelia grisea]|uniref:GST N-terminal domain-containing protein n=1 Tax=Hohenbuehelia grisea TaxID=104357 RepID=A0ABR3K1J1_9AGAR